MANALKIGDNTDVPQNTATAPRIGNRASSVFRACQKRGADAKNIEASECVAG
jgi:hypothetical protein